MISERWEIRSDDQKIEKFSITLDGHGDEGNGSYVFKLYQDMSYSSLTGDPKPCCDQINHKMLNDILTTQIGMHGFKVQTEYVGVECHHMASI